MLLRTVAALIFVAVLAIISMGTTACGSASCNELFSEYKQSIARMVDAKTAAQAWSAARDYCDSCAGDANECTGRLIVPIIRAAS